MTRRPLPYISSAMSRAVPSIASNSRVAFLPAQHRGNSGAAPGELEPGQVARLAPQRLPEKEDQGIERLFLRGHRDASVDRQIAQKGLEVLAASGFQVPRADELGQPPGRVGVVREVDPARQPGTPRDNRSERFDGPPGPRALQTGQPQ